MLCFRFLLHNFNCYTKQFAQLDDAQYEKAIGLIKKGADSDDVFEELIGFSDIDED